MAEKLDGKAFAAGLREKIKAQVGILQDQHDLTPGLAVVIVGEDPASQIYVRNKVAQTTEVGMNSIEHRLPESTSQEELLALVDTLNTDPDVHGILVQLPLPAHIDEPTVLAAIAHEKDADGFHVINAGLLATGGAGAVPCTPKGCMMLIESVLGPDLSGKRALVIGRSNIVGKPMAQLLLQANATVTMAHSRTEDLPGECRRADIVVAAVGRPEMVRGNWLKHGVVVIDVGMNRVPKDDGSGKNRLCGDVHFAEAAEKASHITPVPGGVGPMTIACLLDNTVDAACRAAGVDRPGV